jgi:hypothetical protein
MQQLPFGTVETFVGAAACRDERAHRFGFSIERV